MSNALTIYNQYSQIEQAASALVKSGYFRDVTSVSQAIVKVLAGAELGIPPFASMSGIHIVQGKPVLGANVIATLVKNDPRYNYAVKICDDTECVIEWSEDGKPSGESSFTINEAQRAGLTGKDSWKKYPSDMLFARAISRGARRFAPGVFGGSPVYTPDELGIDEDGSVVDAVDAKIVSDTVEQIAEGVTVAKYLDGTIVGESALNTFGEYCRAHDGRAPKNVYNLRNWWKQQSQINTEMIENAEAADVS